MMSHVMSTFSCKSGPSICSSSRVYKFIFRTAILLLPIFFVWGGVTLTLAQTTYTWTGSNNGEWTVASNWNPQGIPGKDDTAIINSGSVVINTEITVSTLNLASTLEINATFILTDAFNWTGGTLTGSGTLALAATLTGTISSSSPKIITGALIINQAGTVNWTGGVIRQSQASGDFNNLGLFDIQGDLILGEVDDFGGRFNNTGTLRKSAGNGTATIERSVRLANTGTIEALAGTLSIFSGLSNPDIELLHTGAFHIGVQGELRFAGGTHRIGETGTISGPAGGPAQGGFRQTLGTLTVDGELLLGGQANLSDGTLTINTSASMPNLTLSFGTLAVNATLTLTEALNWIGGTITGSGTLSLAATLTGTISSSSPKIITGALTINQTGTVNWTGGEIRQSQASGDFNNSGLFDIQGDLILGEVNVFGGRFNNTGTLRKSAGNGTATIERSVRLANTGTIEALAGTLAIFSGLNNVDIELLHTGAFRIGAQSELRFAAGTHRIGETGQITGLGTLSLAGGTFTNDGTVSPGLPTGILNVSGNFPFSSQTSVLDVGLGGDIPGNNQDKLIVSGNASLNGTLDISLTDDFQPSDNQEFTVLQAGSLNGTFNDVTYPDLGNGFGFVPTYTGNSVILQYQRVEFVPPVAVNDTASTFRDIAVDIDVLANDSDPDGGQLQLTSVSQPQNGAAQILSPEQGGNGQPLVRYTPAQGFIGQDQFTYVITNTDGLTDTASVLVSVLEPTLQNNPPLAVNDTTRTVVNLQIVINVLANDTDPDGDVLTILGFEDPAQAGGRVEPKFGDLLIYTPPPGFKGIDRFRYSITDGRGGIDTALVVVYVTTVGFEVIRIGPPSSRARSQAQNGAMAGNRIGAEGIPQAFYLDSDTEVFFPTGAFGSEIFGISGSEMAGVVRNSATTGTAHRFRINGTIEPVEGLGGESSLGYAINSAGEMTGVATDNLGRERAFLARAGQPTIDITPDGFEHSAGLAINESGCIAGVVRNSAGEQRAWIASQVMNQPESRANAVNMACKAAGSLFSNGRVRAATWSSNGDAIILPDLGHDYTEALAINDAGWVVGVARSVPSSSSSNESITATSGLNNHSFFGIKNPFGQSMIADEDLPDSSRAVVWIDGDIFDLNELIEPESGWTLLEATAINSDGQIVGTGILNGDRRSFQLGFNFVIVSIETREALPERLELGQNYPNPFNSRTNIPVTLQEAGHVRLQLFDMLGRPVAVIFEGPLQAGVHHLGLDAVQLPSGIYLYRLSSSTGVFTRKMTLIK